MVYPSRGCHTCKQRRIKCDSVRPLCGRCRKANYSCTWDTEEEKGLPFRSENAFARGLPRRPRNKSGLEQTSTVLMTRPRVAIASTLSLPMELHAVNYWVENFAFGTNDISDLGHEYSSYVLPYWQRARQDSSLQLALLAVAHAAFGHARRSSKAIRDSNKLYYRALMQTKSDIEHVQAGETEKLLVTIMLLNSFDEIMWGKNPHNPRDPDLGFDEIGSRIWEHICHHKGATGLLKLRNTNARQLNLPLRRVVRRQVIRTMILRGATVPEWLQGPEYEEGHMQKFDILMTRLAELRYKSLYLFGNNHMIAPRGCCAALAREGFLNHETPPYKIATEAETLDNDFESWASSAPNDWEFLSYTTLAGQASFAEDFSENSTSHTFTSYGNAAMWNRYCAARLVVNSIRMRSLNFLLHFAPQFPLIAEQKEACIRNIISSAKDLCSGVSIFFGSPQRKDGFMAWAVRIGDRTIYTDREILPKMAVLVAWPLVVAVSSEGVPMPQKQWLLSRLKSVAETLGDAVLMSVVEKGEFKF